RQPVRLVERSFEVTHPSLRSIIWSCDTFFGPREDARAGRFLSGVHHSFRRRVMRTRQGSVLEALRRSKDFLDANAQLLEAVNKSSARRNLDDIVAQLTAHSAIQDGSGRASTGETARQRSLRVALR